MKKQAKILIIDIETAPALGYVWRIWKENVGLNQLEGHGYVMSFAAKWLGDDKVVYEEQRGFDDKELIQKLNKLLDEADIVVAHNGDKFDLPTVRSRSAVHKLLPPSPYRTIDTLKVAKREFRFLSNKLEFLADVLGCAPKLKHAEFPGFLLWKECMNGNDKAWEEMKAYNIQDVNTLEDVYLAIRPWIRNHPNLGVYQENKGERPVCPKCGKDHTHYRGYAYTNLSKFRRFVCMDCGAWGRERVNQIPKEERKVLGANIIG